MRATPPFVIREKIRPDDIVVVKLGGRLDTPHESTLARRIMRLISEGYLRIIVECVDLMYLSSRGVSAFVAVIDDLRDRGGDLKLLGVKKQAALVMDRLGLSRFIQRFDTVEQAERAFETPIEEFLSATGLERFVAAEGALVFHASACALASRIRRKVTFSSKAVAREAGLRPCRRCC